MCLQEVHLKLIQGFVLFFSPCCKDLFIAGSVCFEKLMPYEPKEES